MTSALLNIHYDIPTTDYTIGFGGGRYLDGDIGIEARGIYRPSQGWQIEGFATVSSENDKTYNNKNTNLFAGLKVTMPLGQFKGLPNNSRQTFDFKPLARDKGQRINNPYPLYDITDPWQTRELYKYWNRVVE